MSTFTWKSSDGRTFDVEPDFDVDQWAGREMRAAERLLGGILDGAGFYATTSLVMAIAIARVVPGYTVESADAELTFGRLRGILDELGRQDQAAAAAVDALPSDPEPEAGAVLSPTRPDEPGDTQPPA